MALWAFLGLVYHQENWQREAVHSYFHKYHILKTILTPRESQYKNDYLNSQFQIYPAKVQLYYWESATVKLSKVVDLPPPYVFK